MYFATLQRRRSSQIETSSTAIVNLKDNAEVSVRFTTASPFEFRDNGFPCLPTDNGYIRGENQDFCKLPGSFGCMLRPVGAWVVG
jgi:hypothetical protein